MILVKWRWLIVSNLIFSPTICTSTNLHRNWWHHIYTMWVLIYTQTYDIMPTLCMSSYLHTDWWHHFNNIYINADLHTELHEKWLHYMMQGFEHYKMECIQEATLCWIWSNIIKNGLRLNLYRSMNWHEAYATYQFESHSGHGNNYWRNSAAKIKMSSIPVQLTSSDHSFHIGTWTLVAHYAHTVMLYICLLCIVKCWSWSFTCETVMLDTDHRLMDSCGCKVTNGVTNCDSSYVFRFSNNWQMFTLTHYGKYCHWY
jgi:hypothetical protein